MARKSNPPKDNPRSSPPSPAAGDGARDASGDEGAVLWRKIAGTIKPLKRRSDIKRAISGKIVVPQPSTLAEEKAPPVVRRGPMVPKARPQSPLVSGAAPGMDKRTAMRLRRGQIDIDGRIDLRGMTQQEAHGNLSDFIKYSAGAGRRCLLVITGKGIGKGGLGGVLRAQLPSWLNSPELRSLILAFAPAQPRDGGGGAFYVYLRKRRDQ